MVLSFEMMNKVFEICFDDQMTRGGKLASWPIAWGILALLSLSSCIPEPLEVEGVPTPKPMIVVSSQIIANQSVVVLLTRTISALDASDDSDPEDLIDQIAVNDAAVFIVGPDDIYTFSFLGNGLYGAPIIPFQEGAAYTLEVKSESLGEVKATTIVQPQIAFSKIEAELYLNGFRDTLAQINYTLHDPQEENYYMINVQEVERVDAVENLINPRAFTRLVRDNAFNGQEFGEQFRVFDRDYKPGDTIAVSLSNINKDYFQFMQQRIDNRFSLVEFLGEPVNYPSNVEGGKGFFNLYTPDVRFFILE
jgi:hypothetical protein